MQSEIKKRITDIRASLIKMIPEKWESIILYASVIEERKGEMFFYYYPKKLIKTNPINCYEIPDKFGLNEEVYSKGLKDLYDQIKALRAFAKPKWTNITILYKDGYFTIEFHYNDLMHTRYTDDQRRIVWTHKYLNIPLESLDVKDQALIKSYKEETNLQPTILTLDEKEGDVLGNEKEQHRIKNQILKT